VNEGFVYFGDTSTFKKQEIHPKAFRLTLFKGYRQNEVEILPSWFIYRKEEISLVKTVANKKGLGDKKRRSWHWLKM